MNTNIAWRRRCSHCKEIVFCGIVSLVKRLIIQDEKCPKCGGYLDIFQIGHMKMKIKE